MKVFGRKLIMDSLVITENIFPLVAVPLVKIWFAMITYEPRPKQQPF